MEFKLIKFNMGEKMEFKLEFGKRLQSARGNTPVKEVAEIFEINVLTYCNYERGVRVPNAEFLYRFCQHFNIDYHWLFTGVGNMYKADGVKLDLLYVIIDKIENHLESDDIFLSSRKKAQIISILYEEALNNPDWHKQLGIVKKTLQFAELLTDQKGQIQMQDTFEERLMDLVDSFYSADLGNRIVQEIEKAKKTDECLTSDQRSDMIIVILQERMEKLQRLKEKKEGKYVFLAFFCVMMMAVAVKFLGSSSLISYLISSLFFLFAMLSGVSAGKAKSQIRRTENDLRANTDLFVSLLKEKIFRKNKEKIFNDFKRNS